jgi:hypothetical protein
MKDVKDYRLCFQALANLETDTFAIEKDCDLQCAAYKKFIGSTEPSSSAIQGLGLLTNQNRLF